VKVARKEGGDSSLAGLLLHPGNRKEERELQEYPTVKMVIIIIIIIIKQVIVF
jgi:hypothetical protein